MQDFKYQQTVVYYAHDACGFRGAGGGRTVTLQFGFLSLQPVDLSNYWSYSSHSQVHSILKPADLKGRSLKSKLPKTPCVGWKKSCAKDISYVDPTENLKSKSPCGARELTTNIASGKVVNDHLLM